MVTVLVHNLVMLEFVTRITLCYFNSFRETKNGLVPYSHRRSVNQTKTFGFEIFCSLLSLSKNVKEILRDKKKISMLIELLVEIN